MNTVAPPSEELAHLPKRREHEGEDEFLERVAEYFALLRRAELPGFDGKPPRVGLA